MGCGRRRRGARPSGISSPHPPSPSPSPLPPPSLPHPVHGLVGASRACAACAGLLAWRGLNPGHGAARSTVLRRLGRAGVDYRGPLKVAGAYQTLNPKILPARLQDRDFPPRSSAACSSSPPRAPPRAARGAAPAASRRRCGRRGEGDYHLQGVCVGCGMVVARGARGARGGVGDPLRTAQKPLLEKLS